MCVYLAYHYNYVHVCSASLKLSQRLDYISRSVMCAKSSGAVTNISGEGEFLHELEEKMEVSCATCTHVHV